MLVSTRTPLANLQSHLAGIERLLTHFLPVFLGEFDELLCRHLSSLELLKQPTSIWAMATSWPNFAAHGPLNFLRLRPQEVRILRSILGMSSRVGEGGWFLFRPAISSNSSQERGRMRGSCFICR